MDFIYNDYYVKHKKKLLKDFDKMCRLVKPILLNDFSSDDVDNIITSSAKEYEELLPELQYIGGKGNRGTNNLIMSAQALAFVKVLERKGLQEREIGKFIYNFIKAFIDSLPTLLKKLIGVVFKTKLGSSILLRRSASKKYVHYKGGWLTDIADNKDKKFDGGIDIKACGICELYKKQNAFQYVKYMCLGDYLMFGSFGVCLKRTTTMAHGAEKCDFRFHFDEKPLEGWPPEKLDEWNE